MRTYELTIIVGPNVDEDGVNQVVENLTNFVQANNGEVASTDMWGRRTLAYPINKHREGTYVLFNLNLDPGILAELERNLKLSERIIRYLLLVKEDS